VSAGGESSSASAKASTAAAAEVAPRAGRLKQVLIHKSDAEELGMAILGGREHGLPIMISEVFPNSAVGRCKKIVAGDVIAAVNGDSFEEMGHHEAVRWNTLIFHSLVNLLR